MSIRTLVGSGPLRACAAAVVVVGLLLAVGTAAAAGPPDGRAYELVSPPDKLGAIPSFPGGLGSLGFVDFGTLSNASADGAHVIWFSTAAFGNATSAIPMNFESSRASSGWTTVQASPDPTEPHPNVFLSISNLTDATSDFSTRIVQTSQTYDPLSQGIFRLDLYAQDADRNLTWLTRPDDGSADSVTAVAEYVGRDADASHVLFRTPEALVPAAASQVAASLYDRTGGHTVLVNVDTGGTPIGNCGATIGFEPEVGSVLPRLTMKRTVSDDGSHIFFTTPNARGSGDPSCSDPQQLYLRVGNATTVQVSASQRTISDPGGTQTAAFQGASVDGGKVFFMSSEALTDDAADGAGDAAQLLYEYDVPSGQLSLLTPNGGGNPSVQGVVGLSADGSRLYFIARGVLAPGATGGSLNLYTYAGGQTTFVAATNDDTLLDTADFGRQMRMTDDGNRIVFASSSNLTSYDSGGFQEIYLYDAAQDAMQCISCPGDGSPATGDAFLSEDGGNSFRSLQSRNVVDGGHRVFFESPDSLVPQDDNGVMDVYEWHDGTVRLISGGHGNDGSYFMDSGNDGSDAFFVTSDRLVSQDGDGDPDIYDARIGGGFPAAPGSTSVCVDDQCQGQPSAPPSLPAIASGTNFGLGNATSGHHVRLVVHTISAQARRRFARTGKLTLTFQVGASGTARSVAIERIDKRTVRVAHGSARASRAGAVKLRLTLSQAARRRLEQAGRLRVTIVVTFPGATSRTATLVLVQPNRPNR